MESLKEKLVNQLQEYKKMSITLDEIYKLSGLTIVPTTITELNSCINELVAEDILQPLKSSKKNTRGMFLKYKVFKHDNDLEIKDEIVQTLIKPIKIEYYLKRPKEYVKNREFIQKINSYLKLNKQFKSKDGDITCITVNERSYQLFKNEKILKEKEDILKKLGITFETLNCYDTYEPFFCYINPEFNGTEKIIIIVENKDTFWSTKKAVKDNSNIYMVIYGEGKKILKSFSYIKEFDISYKDKILYFGDIDYEGINICMSLINLYPSYNIQIFKGAYEKCLDIEDDLQNIRHTQNKVEHYIKEFCNCFTGMYKDKLLFIFKNNLYIPQEVVTYMEMLKIFEKWSEK